MGVSRSYVELIFRHKFVLILPIVIAFTAGTMLALQAPRKYVANASVWTDTRVPAESTVGTTGGLNPPSAGRAALLTQLLSTRAFLLNVVNVSPLAAEYRNSDPVSRNALLGEVSSSAWVATPGPQLLALTVTREDPDEATGLASAILQEFERAEVDEATTRAIAQLEFDRRRMDAAQQLAEESDSDATQDLYAEAAAAFNQSTLNLAAVESSGLRVVDAPDTAEPQARKKTVVFGAAGGLLAGLTLSLIALILLMVRDRSLRAEDHVTAAGFELAGSVPDAGRRRRGSEEEPSEEKVGL